MRIPPSPPQICCSSLVARKKKLVLIRNKGDSKPSRAHPADSCCATRKECVASNRCETVNTTNRRSNYKNIQIHLVYCITGSPKQAKHRSDLVSLESFITAPTKSSKVLYFRESASMYFLRPSLVKFFVASSSYDLVALS